MSECEGSLCCWGVQTAHWVEEVLGECEGSPRRSHAFLSTSNVVEIDVIVAKVLKVHFLLHFQGN